MDCWWKKELKRLNKIVITHLLEGEVLGSSYLNYSILIKEINEANDWKKLRTVYEKGFHGEFEQKLLTAFNGKNLQNLIEQEAEIIIQLIKKYTDKNTDELTKRINELETDLETHELKLPADKEIKKLKLLLDNQKEKLVFREKFRKRVGENITISDDTIDLYFNKGLAPEKAVNAYSHHNIYQRISAAEIDNGRVFFTRKIYNLYEEEGLKNLQKDKIFIYDFRNQGNFSSRLVAEEILTYHKVSSNQKYWITGQQAFNAYQKGWIQPNQIRINDNNQKQINLGTGWKGYDWEQYSFNEVKEKELNNLQTQIEIPPK